MFFLLQVVFDLYYVLTQKSRIIRARTLLNINVAMNYMYYISVL